MGWFDDLFMTGGRADAPYNSNLREVPRAARAEEKPVASFITVQTLASFPGAALAVTIVWRFLATALGWDSRAVPLITSFVVGAILYIVTLEAARPKTIGQWLSGLFIAAINSMYLGLSVLGIDIGLALTGVADSVPS
jgi:hypothetical protein